MPEFITQPLFEAVNEIQNLKDEVRAEVVNERYQKILNRTDWLKQHADKIYELLKVTTKLKEPGYDKAPIAKVIDFLISTQDKDKGIYPANSVIATDNKGNLVWEAKQKPAEGGGAVTSTNSKKYGIVNLLDRLDRYDEENGGGGNDLRISRKISVGNTWIPRNFTSIDAFGDYSWISFPSIPLTPSPKNFPQLVAEQTEGFPEQPQFVDRDGRPIHWNQQGFSAFTLQPGTYVIRGYGMATRCECAQVRLVRIKPKIEYENFVLKCAIYGSVAANVAPPVYPDPKDPEIGSIHVCSHVQGIIHDNEDFFPEGLPATYGFQIIAQNVDRFEGDDFTPARNAFSIAGGIGIKTDVTYWSVQNIFSALSIERVD